jgi:two-component system, NarL family, sensor histidine kinase BarA
VDEGLNRPGLVEGQWLVSYRSFKHLLGETSLERKCRFIFGLGILVLVSGSFFWYGQKTESLVRKQTTQTARMLVNPTLLNIHYKSLGNTNFEPILKVLVDDFKPLGDLPKYDAWLLDPDRPTDPNKQPKDDFEREALSRFVKASATQKQGPSQEKQQQHTFADGTPTWYHMITNDKKEYHYVQAVFFKPNCLMDCHGRDDMPIERNHGSRLEPDGQHWVKTEPGDLAGAVVVSLPMDQTTKAINNNRAMLITAALVTAVLAMFSSLMIVRYVIVKPVKHLRDVSDAIAAGRLNIRSQIETGDEFEELSHAFNRMLHNLVAMQQELREVNNDLDRKVDELAQANMALFEMNRLKSDFLATMSHELRTPLNSIIGFSEVLSGTDQLNERHRRYAANIQSSGKMLLSMINDILDLAKIESGKMEVRPEDFSIRDVCEGLTNLARPIAERKNITLECRIDEAIPLLRQDPGKLRQILYNLLSNAIKFTPEGGRVTLRARAEGRFVVLEVEDTGIGIAEDEREAIFEKFRQAKAPGQGEDVLTREHQGTGLGLSIVRELTKLLGGDVYLESQPGQGSIFTIRIPLMLSGNRKFEVALSDERIDLTKARRIEARAPLPHLDLGRSPSSPPPVDPPDPVRWRRRDRSKT